jgi:hypothetical protein
MMGSASFAANGTFEQEEMAGTEMDAKELGRKIVLNCDLDALAERIREHGQAYIGSEDAFKASYGVDADELEAALTAGFEEVGMYPILAGLDGNWPGDWFVGILLNSDTAGEILAGWTGMTPEEVVKRYAERQAKVDEAAAWMAGRLEALMIMPMDHLKALAISLGVAEAELTTRYAAAREIIWAEDQYPIWRWFDPIQVEIVLADRPRAGMGSFGT